MILTTIGYPKWVNGTHVPGTPYTEIVFDSRNFVIPPNNVLMLPTRKPPNRRSRFLPEDFMYFQWVNYLMNMLHPRNFASDAKINGKRVWIDAFELVNEPNLLPAALDGTRRYQSTALMMNTARQVKTQLNRKYGGGLKLLGPATAASSRAGGDKDYRRFTTALIDQLVSDNRGKPIVDRDFGWSHHNYEDVEQIGQTLGAGGRQAINTAAAALPPAAQQALARKAKKAMYGRSTQLVRDRLRGKWKGWIDPGDPEPGLFLTEGGCRIEHMPGFTADRPQPDPNAHYANGVKTSDPAAAQKRLQADSVGAAAEALKDRTKGVEMFTNFLFFDDTPLNFSGLCDHYAPARVQPPYARSSKVPQAPAPNESAKQYERPAYSNWKKFGL